MENLEDIPLPPSPAPPPPPAPLLQQVEETGGGGVEELEEPLEPSDDAKVEQNRENAEENGENVENRGRNSIEEDEDVMRAMLLASMSKKITSTVAPEMILKDAANSANKAAAAAASSNRKKLVTVLPAAPMTKIIINVNSESDSDGELPAPGATARPAAAPGDDFNRNLSMLLKRARDDAEDKSGAAAAPEELDKSVVKLLPRSQQAEYKQLKRKLQMLKERKAKKGAAAGPPRKAEEPKAKPNSTAKTFKVNNVLRNKMQQKQQRCQQQQQKEEEPKNRYLELEPLMRQIDEVRRKRDEEQAGVQNLLAQLKIARNRLSTVHQHFTTLVQKLVTAKANIDTKCEMAIVVPPNATLCTSTPNKRPKSAEKEVFVQMSPIIVDKPPSQKQQTLQLEEPKDLLANKDEDNETIIQVGTIDGQRKVAQENITISENKGEDGLRLPYVSPLMHMNDRQGYEDPFQIICPYELQGVCRDTECKFQHCCPTTTDHL